MVASPGSSCLAGLLLHGLVELGIDLGHRDASRQGEGRGKTNERGAHHCAE